MKKRVVMSHLKSPPKCISIKKSPAITDQSMQILRLGSKPYIQMSKRSKLGLNLKNAVFQIVKSALLAVTGVNFCFRQG